MNVEIINKSFSITVHGFSGTVINKDHVDTAFKLMDKMWKGVKGNNLKNKGLNIWIYEPGDMLFAGVELEESPATEIGLEQKSVTLARYAYYKHVGPYNLIKQMGQTINEELRSRGYEVGLPNIEIYGHWTTDESKLETELLVSLK